jgi:hypothetical protein
VRGKATRRGAALVEVLISLVLLATAGTALVSFLGQTAHTLRQLRDEERLVRRASAELETLVLWDRPTLIGRIGRSRAHDWTLVVRQSTPELFDVSIAESDTSVVLLRTTLYRPDSIDAARP